MTFPQSGTLNSVQTALMTTSAVIASWVSLEASSFPPVGPSLTSFPVSLQHGAVESNWIDPGSINHMNVVLTQSNYSYRI